LHELLKNTLQIAAELVRMAMHHQKRRSIPHAERKSWRGGEEKRKPTARERWKLNPKKPHQTKEIKTVNLYMYIYEQGWKSIHKKYKAC
jgi:hypothetical protein